MPPDRFHLPRWPYPMPSTATPSATTSKASATGSTPATSPAATTVPPTVPPPAQPVPTVPPAPTPGALPAIAALNAIHKDAQAALAAARSRQPSGQGDYGAAIQALQAGLQAVQRDAQGSTDPTVLALSDMAANSTVADNSQASYASMSAALQDIAQRAVQVPEPADSLKAVQQAAVQAQMAIAQEAARLGALNRPQLTAAVQAKAAQLQQDKTPLIGFFSQHKAGAMVQNLDAVLALDTAPHVAALQALMAQYARLQAGAANARTAIDAQMLADQAQQTIQGFQTLGVQVQQENQQIDGLESAAGLPALPTGPADQTVTASSTGNGGGTLQRWLGKLGL